MLEIRETSPAKELKHGHVGVGVTAVPLTNLSFKLDRGLLVRAPGAADSIPNTAAVWVGRQAVTADLAVGTGGMPLLPGQSLVLPVDDPSQIWVVSTVAAQDLAWMGV
jgi:hypothetical protein